jgi:hypothetical protein
MDAPLDLGDGCERVLWVGEVDLDVVRISTVSCSIHSGSRYTFPLPSARQRHNVGKSREPKARAHVLAPDCPRWRSPDAAPSAFLARLWQSPCVRAASAIIARSGGDRDPGPNPLHQRGACANACTEIDIEASRTRTGADMRAASPALPAL